MQKKSLKIWPLHMVPEKFDALFWEEGPGSEDRCKILSAILKSVPPLSLKWTWIYHPDSFSKFFPCRQSMYDSGEFMAVAWIKTSQSFQVGASHYQGRNQIKIFILFLFGLDSFWHCRHFHALDEFCKIRSSPQSAPQKL